jgi:hypothetical protein
MIIKYWKLKLFVVCDVCSRRVHYDPVIKTNLTSDNFIVAHILFHFSMVNFNQKLCGFLKLWSDSDTF